MASPTDLSPSLSASSADSCPPDCSSTLDSCTDCRERERERDGVWHVSSHQEMLTYPFSIICLKHVLMKHDTEREESRQGERERKRGRERGEGGGWWHGVGRDFVRGCHKLQTLRTYAGGGHTWKCVQDPAMCECPNETETQTASPCRSLRVATVHTSMQTGQLFLEASFKHLWLSLEVVGRHRPQVSQWKKFSRPPILHR